MAPTIVAHPRPASNVVPLRHALAYAQETVDHVAELRDLIRRAQEQERALTRELIETMHARGLRALQGAKAVAVLEDRTSLTPDVGLFLEAAGARAPEALTVSVTRARTLVGEEILQAISETVTATVLRVEVPADATRGVDGSEDGAATPIRSRAVLPRQDATECRPRGGPDHEPRRTALAE